MKWSNRIQILTGQSGLHLVLNLLLMATLIVGWQHKALVVVSGTFVLLYAVILMAMLLMQRFSHMRNVLDFLEDLTTNWYFVAAMLLLFLISRLIHNPLLLGCVGGIILFGPAITSLVMPAWLRQERRG